MNEKFPLTQEEAALIDRNEVGPSNLTEEEELYKENIIDHYKYPHNTGVLKDYTFSRREFNPLCGDDIALYVKVSSGEISDISFVGKGCAISQASISMLTDKVKGMQLKEAKDIKREEVLGMLGIPIGIVRMKCALLSLKALSRGIEQFETGGQDEEAGSC